VQADELTRLGCDQAQGFLFARPDVAEVITPMLGCSPVLAPR
jgi:EAL domain-containing protein (putative c-di-GMP-specific phosphodiesterase class I)